MSNEQQAGLPLDQIVCGDNLDVMRGWPDAFVDAVVTDPPYGLEFMGKEWDKLGVHAEARMRRSREVTPRGQGHSTSAGPYLAVGVNSYGHDGPAMQQWHHRWATEALRVAKPGAHLLAFGGTRTHHRLMCAIEDAGWEIRDCLMFLYGTGFPKSLDVSKAIDKAAGVEREVVGQDPARVGRLVNQMERSNLSETWKAGKRCVDVTIPATEAAKQWEGWGTALKPAWEIIVLARKPLDGTVAQNVLKHGVGGLNIDGCRVSIKRSNPYAQRRWPANVVHDGSDEVVGMFPETTSGGAPKRRYSDKTRNTFGKFNGTDCVTGITGSEGSAARFFYTAKASKADRTPGNDHPCVKPVDLMRWLVRLVCPPGGIVLDPFNGSGSTTYAAREEHCRFIGIDTSEEYCAIARKRLAQKLLPFS